MRGRKRLIGKDPAGALPVVDNNWGQTFMHIRGVFRALLGRPALGLAFALGLLVPSVASAQDQERLVVVELFTSQGCAACPPADALLGELATRDDVLPLALHVDYWDYIGWADTFATPAFTERQRRYGQAAGTTMVYTPQMIIGGQDHVAGTRPMAVARLIEAHRDAGPAPVAIEIRTDGDVLVVALTTTLAPPRPAMVVQLVHYSPEEEVHIARGERAGTVGHHFNVVASWQVVATWDGAAPFSTEIPAHREHPSAIIVQEAGHGPILAAARVP
jgi:hypothetical protein